MKQENQDRAKKLAFVNSVSENAYSPEMVAKELLILINENEYYTKKFKEYYGVSDDKELSVETVSESRNWIKTGGEADTERTSQYILRDFRDGKIGKFILDKIDEG
jgi:ribosome biogenesis GTPase A